MNATFTMSFGGLDFCLTPINRQAGISFQPPACENDEEDDDDDAVVLRLDSFTGTLKICHSSVLKTAVSPRSGGGDKSCISSNISRDDENCVTCGCCRSPPTMTLLDAAGADEAAVAPANVTPKMSPRRNNVTADPMTNSTTIASSPTAAGTAGSNAHCPTIMGVADQLIFNDQWRDERTDILASKNKRGQDLNASSSSSTDERAILSKRTRYNDRPQRSASKCLATGEAQPYFSTTTNLCDSPMSHRLIYLGQTPDFSQPSIGEEYQERACRGDSGGGDSDESPLLFPERVSTTIEQQTPLIATENAAAGGLSVQEILNQTSNSAHSQGDDCDHYDYNNDEEIEEDNEEDHDGDQSGEDVGHGIADTAMLVYKEATEAEVWAKDDTSFIRRPISALPLPRWGHTMTKIGDNQLLIYGGQAFETTSLPTTLSDVHVYDLAQRTWHQPVNCDGLPRQWHTATYLPKRQLLISFGGESADPNTGKITTTDQVMVLDTEIMLWYPPTVTGTAPSGRSGHTATLLNKGNDLVVFGGVKGAKWLNSVSVLDTMRWKWSAPKITGAAPKPRSYHTATAICRNKKNRIVIFGGNNADSSFDGVHVLEKEDKVWSWIHPMVRGTGPSPRTGHTATLLDDQKTILVYGGWDVNASDEETIFGDCFLLDTETWIWKEGPRTTVLETKGCSHLHWDAEKRVGHTAVLTQRQEGTEVLLFGGRIPNDKFCNDFQRVLLQHEAFVRPDR